MDKRRTKPSKSTSASSYGSATFSRCPTTSLNRVRGLNEAEWITLFTPVIPHPPSTVLAKDMDPFEPLGRSLPRQVRHVPYRLDNGMTDTHIDFLRSSGAILVVACSPESVLLYNAKAYELQTKFARDVAQKVSEDPALAEIPVILLLITNGTNKRAHEEGVADFPALITCSNYTTAALENVVRVMFGS